MKTRRFGSSAAVLALVYSAIFSSTLLAQQTPLTPCRTTKSLPCQLPGNGPFISGNLLVQVPLGVFDLSINSQFSGVINGGIRPDYGFGPSATLFGHLTIDGGILKLTSPTGLDVRYTRQAGRSDYASEDFFVGDVSTITASGGGYILRTPQLTITYGQSFGGRYLPTKFVEVGPDNRSLTITYVNGVPSKIETGPFLSSITIGSDSFGHVNSLTNYSTGEVTKLDYHPTGQVASITGPDGKALTLQYHPDGNLASYTDSLGRSTTYTFHSHNVIESVTDHRGVKTTYSYIGPEMVTQTSNSSGPIEFLRAKFSLTPFDQRMRITSMTSGEGLLPYTAQAPQQIMERDYFGAVTKLTDEMGETTEYFYRLDALCGHPASTFERSPLATCVRDSTGVGSFRVDPNNLYRPTRTTKSTRSGQPIVNVELTWSGGIVSGTSVSDGSGGLLSNTTVTLNASGVPTRSETTRTTRLSYDGQGRLLSRKGPDGTLALQYGSNGNISSVQQNGVTTSIDETISPTGDSTITQTTGRVSTVTSSDLLRRKVTETIGNPDTNYILRQRISSQRNSTERNATQFQEEIAGSSRFSVKNSAATKSSSAGTTSTEIKSRSNASE